MKQDSSQWKLKENHEDFVVVLRLFKNDGTETSVFIPHTHFNDNRQLFSDTQWEKANELIYNDDNDFF